MPRRAEDRGRNSTLRGVEEQVGISQRRGRELSEGLEGALPGGGYSGERRARRGVEDWGGDGVFKQR